MEQRSYYVILGVPRGESPRGIRAAYRDLARKLHPDVAGAAATRSFQELGEAYAVLSDARRRGEYNDRLSREEARERPARRAPRFAPEPLIRDAAPILGGEPESIHPSLDAMHARFERNFTGVGVPKAERLAPLDFHVVLSRQEASAGCVIPVGIPVFARCPWCDGSGRDWLAACPRCRQRGVIEHDELVSIRIPAMPPPVSVYEVPLEPLGIHNFYLRLRVFVEA